MKSITSTLMSHRNSGPFHPCSHPLPNRHCVRRPQPTDPQTICLLSVSPRESQTTQTRHKLTTQPLTLAQISNTVHPQSTPITAPLPQPVAPDTTQSPDPPSRPRTRYSQTRSRSRPPCRRSKNGTALSSPSTPPPSPPRSPAPPSPASAPPSARCCSRRLCAARPLRRVAVAASAGDLP